MTNRNDGNEVGGLSGEGEAAVCEASKARLKAHR